MHFCEDNHTIIILHCRAQNFLFRVRPVLVLFVYMTEKLKSERDFIKYSGHAERLQYRVSCVETTEVVTVITK